MIRTDCTGTAARIHYHRVRAGKSTQEVVARLGINEAWYHDLEHRDEELASTLTLFQAMELAAFLGVRMRDLLPDARWPDDVVPLTELPSRVRAHVAAAGTSLEEFEEQVGWELREFLQSPLKVTAEFPISFLQALADRLGIDWRSMIPDEHAAGATPRHHGTPRE